MSTDSLPRRGAAARWLGVAVFAAAATAAFAPGCALIEPEVGERIERCSDADSNPAVAVDFARDIRPLMNGERPPIKGCKNCHYPGVGTQEGFFRTGLNLSQLVTLRKGGANTGLDVVVPGSPCKSAIVQKLRGTRGGVRMPKDGPYWGPAEIQLMMDWIAEGAKGADGD